MILWWLLKFQARQKVEATATVQVYVLGSFIANAVQKIGDFNIVAPETWGAYAQSTQEKQEKTNTFQSSAGQHATGPI